MKAPSSIFSILLFFFFNLSYSQCPISPGDQITYGDEQWIGYIYGTNNASNPPTDAFTTTYRGYIEQNSIFDLNIENSDLTGPNLCGNYSDNFSIRFKMRKNFIPGYYKFDVGGDDGFRLSVDGGLTYIINSWNDHLYLTQSETVYLSGQQDLVLEYYDKNQEARISFSYHLCDFSSTAPTGIISTNPICNGQTVTLTAIGGEEGVGSTYEWGQGTEVGLNVIVGQTSNSISVTPSATTNYWVRRKSSSPCLLTTEAYQQLITVVNPPVLPTSITGLTSVCFNQNTVLTANGYFGDIQWQTSYDNITYNDVIGETSSLLELNNVTQNVYVRVKVEREFCFILYSNPILITVLNPSLSGTISGNSSVCSGINSSQLSLQNFNGSIQWQVSDDNITFSDIAGEVSTDLSIVNLTSTKYYRVFVKNGTCDGVYSQSFAVNVLSPPVAGTITGNTSLCFGSNATNLTLSNFSGSIQWQTSTDGVNFTDVNNATNLTLPIINLINSTYFRAKVSNGSCQSTFTERVLVIVNSNPIAGTISGASPVCNGNNSTILSLNNSLGNIQWQTSTDNTIFSDIIGANFSSYTVTNISQTTYFRVVVSNGVCSQAVSPSVVLTVLPNLVGGTISGSTTICSSNNSTLLQASGYVGGIQWQSSLDNATFNDIAGETSNTYTATNVTTTTYYRVVLTNGACSPVTSSVATINYSTSITGTISGFGTVCPGTNVTLTLSGNAGSIQWQSSADNNTFNNISGANSNTYTANNVNNVNFYRVVVTNGVCPSNISNSVLVDLANGANGGSISGGGVTVASGLETRTLTVSNNIGSIQWQSSTDNLTFTYISGATASTFNAVNLTATTFYRVLATQGGCTATSASVAINICSPSTNQNTYGTTNWFAYVYGPNSGGASPSNPFSATYQGRYTATETFNSGINISSGTLCAGNNGSVTTAAYNGKNLAVRYLLTKNFSSASYTFTVGAAGSYRFSVDGGNTWVISNFNRANACSITTSNVTVSLSGSVNMVLEFVSNNCGTGNFLFNYCGSSNITAPTTIIGNTNMQVGTNTTLFASGGSGGTYQWGTGSVIGSNVISGSTGQSIIVYPTVTTTYWVRRYNTSCNSYTGGVTRTVTVNTNTPVTPNGNTTDYGNGVWIGYVYGSSAGQAGSGATAFSSPYKYSGYLTTASDQFSFNQSTGSVMPATSLWNQTTHTTTSGYFDNLYSIRFKMNKNFTPGYYTFTISADDGMRFSVDGGASWIINRWAWSSSGTTNTYSVFLSGSTNLILEFNGGTGGQSLNFSYTSCTNFSTAPTSISGTSSVCSGQSVTLTATGGTTGANGLFQWGTGNVVGQNIISGNSQSITVNPTSPSTTYWVRRIDIGGNCQVSSGLNTNSNTNIRVTTDAVTTGVTTTVTVDAISVAGTITGGGSVCAGNNNTVLTLTGNVGAIQWQTSSDNVSFSNISNATNNTFVVSNITNTTFYRAIVTNGSCNAVITNVVSVVVVPNSVSGTISGGTTVCAGLNSTTLVLNNHLGNIQWQSSTDNVTYSNINGATSTSYTVLNISVPTYYRVRVTNGICSTVVSSPVLVDIRTLAVSGIVSGGSTVCSGANSSLLTITGQTGIIQWQSSTDNVSFTNLSGANATTFTALNLVSTTYYRAAVSATGCNTEYTNSVAVNVTPQPVAGTISGASSVCESGNFTILQLNNSFGSVIWQSSTDNINFSDISEATSLSYNASNLNATTFFRVVVTNGVCNSTLSDSVSIIVSPTPISGSISGAGTFCAGSDVTLTLNGYSGNIQWSSSIDNIIFTNIPGATNSSFTANDLNTTTYFRATLSNGVCNPVLTLPVLVNINQNSIAGTISGATNWCASTNSTLLTLNNYLGNIRWQSSTDNINFTDVPGATSQTYNAINLSSSRYFRVVVTNGTCPPSISDSVAITISPQTIAGVISTTSTASCLSINLSPIVLTGNVGNVLMWQSADNAGFTNGVVNIMNTNSTLTIADIGSLTSTKFFRAVVQNENCSVLYTNVVSKIVPPTAIFNGSWSSTPNSSTSVQILSNLTLNSSLNVCSCEIGNNASLTVNSNRTLTIQGDLNINPSSSLIINDSGSLLQVNDNAMNTGNIVYKRNTSPLKRYDYTYLSSPVTGVNFGNFFSSSLFYTFNPLVNNWFQRQSSTVAIPGVGFIGRAPNNLSYNPIQIVAIQLTGVPNNGVYNVPIIKSTGTFNLIGNPYPSAIDIDEFLLHPDNINIVNGTIYLWTHNTAIANTVPGANIYNYTADDYAKYNLTGGVASAVNAISGGVVPTGKVASGQSFFIEANSSLSNGTYSVKFNNSMRVANNNDQFFRESNSAQSETIQKNRIWLSFTNNTGAYNQSLIGYITGATNSFDNLFDGKTFQTTNCISLYSILDQHKLSIQGRSLPFSDTDVIPLGVSSTISDLFSIGLDNFDGLFSNQTIYLIDKLNNTYHNLKESRYNFNLTAGTYENRFEIRFSLESFLNNQDFQLNNLNIYNDKNVIKIESNINNIKSVVVYDILGKEIVNSKELDTNEYAINLKDLPSQVIIVKVKNNDNIIVNRKLIIN
jgi:hypothetical protein